MRSESLFKKLSALAAAATALIGLMVLTGWLLHIPFLKSILPNFVTMKPNTALCFLLSGIALWLLQDKRADNGHNRRWALFLSGLVFLVGSLTFIEYVLKFNFGIDQLLFKEDPGAILTSSPGRMAFNTAILYILSGAALTALSLKDAILVYSAQALAIIIGFIGLLSFVGYLYGVPPLIIGLEFSTAMALHTTVGFLLISAGCLFARPGAALMAAISNDNIGGITTRRILPIAIIVPLAFGGFKLYAETTNWFDPGFGVVLVALGNILLISTAIYLLSVHLNRMDERRKKAEDDLYGIQKLESLGLLAGGLAHDFNNLLMGVTANLSLIGRKAGGDTEIKELVSETEHAADKARELAGRLLTFAKGGEPVRKLFDLGKTVAEVARFATSGSNCKCEFHAPGEPLAVLADENQVVQVVSNIVANAVQAMPGGGVVTVNAEKCKVDTASGLPLKDGEYARIDFSDTGPGIPEKDLPRLFEPYFSTKPKGHGLGLSIAYSITTKHGGHISVKSVPGKGSVFSVYLPAASAGSLPAAEQSTPAAGGPARVLVMDDEEIVQRATARMLRELGYECVIVADGAAAIEAYKTSAAEGRTFTAVILDLTIPGGMGGAEAVLKIKEIAPKAYVLVSSGYSEDSIVSDYKKSGFDAVLNKPYKFEDLAAAMAVLKK
jgi:signal transduction histidine kinase/ActR/RegA family two-component response regulator